MTDTLRLHYAPDNASLIIRLALEELGLPYETVLVDRSKNAQRSDNYRALNPAGKIPVLETPDGAIFETGAILLWLGDRHQKLLPPPESEQRGDFLKWMFYASNTVHANLRMTFYPEQYVAADHRTALRVGARQNLISSLDMLERLANEGHPWFAGPQVSVLDLYVVAMLRWMALYPANDTDWFDLKRWPHLLHLTECCEARESASALCRAEGMAPKPFSKPAPPNPPEGSAI